MEGKATWNKVNTANPVAANPVAMLDTEGKRVGFRPVKVMEKEVRQKA